MPPPFTTAPRDGFFTSISQSDAQVSGAPDGANINGEDDEMADPVRDGDDEEVDEEAEDPGEYDEDEEDKEEPVDAMAIEDDELRRDTMGLEDSGVDPGDDQ